MNLLGIEITLSSAVFFLSGIIIGVIGTIFTAFISGFFTDYFQRKYDSEKKHFEDIKVQLQELNKDIEKTYGNNLIPPLDLRGDGFGFELLLLSSEVPIETFYSWRRANLMYRDIAEHHYTNLISQYEEAEKQRAHYYLKYLKFTKTLFDDLRKYEISGEIKYTEHIVRYIIESKLHRSTNLLQVTVTLNNGSELTFRQYALAKGKTKTAIESLKRDLEVYTLPTDVKNLFNELMAEQTAIHSKINAVQYGTEKILKNTKLSGHCNYMV